MLLRVADRFGVKVKSLQHVLEGYKVAPEIAAHGASVSLFSDWWAYKIEAFDAIPYAAALLREAGASVCLKSDDNELMRHLYQEAAKLVKYGGISEDEALQTITLNPAKQLGLDSRLGTIEVGKDADLAIFNGHPLNSFGRCEMTLVEGEVYFQRAEKLVPFAGGEGRAGQASREVPRDPRTAEGNVRPARRHDPPAGQAGRSSARSSWTPRAGRSRRSSRAGAKIDAPADAHVVDCTGLHLYPGMIDAGTVLGLIEIGSLAGDARLRATAATSSRTCARASASTRTRN